MKKLILATILVLLVSVSVYSDNYKMSMFETPCVSQVGHKLYFYRLPDSTTKIDSCTTDANGLCTAELPSTGRYKVKDSDGIWRKEFDYVKITADTSYFPEMLVGNGVSPNDASGFLEPFCVSLVAPCYDTVSDAAFIYQYMANKQWTTGLTSPTLGVATRTYNMQQDGVAVTIIGTESGVEVAGPADTMNQTVGVIGRSSMVDGSVGRVNRAIGVMGYVEASGDTHVIPDTSISIYALVPQVGTVKFGILAYNGIHCVDSIWAGTFLKAGTDVEATNDVIAGNDVTANNNITATGVVKAGSNVRAGSQVWVNEDSTEEKPEIVFRDYNGGSPESRSLTYDSLYDAFEFNKRLVISDTTDAPAIFVGWFHELAWRNDRFEFNETVYIDSSLNVQYDILAACNIHADGILSGDTLTIPLTEPGAPSAGMMFTRGTETADTLFIYDGTGWRHLVLTQ